MHTHLGSTLWRGEKSSMLLRRCTSGLEMKYYTLDTHKFLGLLVGSPLMKLPIQVELVRLLHKLPVCKRKKSEQRKINTNNLENQKGILTGMGGINSFSLLSDKLPAHFVPSTTNVSPISSPLGQRAPSMKRPWMKVPSIA